MDKPLKQFDCHHHRLVDTLICTILAKFNEKYDKTVYNHIGAGTSYPLHAVIYYQLRVNLINTPLHE